LVNCILIDNNTGTYNLLNGLLSDFNIYNDVLNQDDILKLYRGDKLNNIIGYTASTIENVVNKYAVGTNFKYYLYNSNERYNWYLASILHSYGIIMRFLFKTNNTINTPLFWLGTSPKSVEVQISIINGCVYLVLGSYVISTKKIANANVWYSFELYTCIMNNRLIISLYINNISQFIRVNNSIYLMTHDIIYDGSLEPLNDMVSYIGAYNPSYMYNDISEYDNGIIFTNTYYNSNVISDVIINNSDFTSNLIKSI